MMKRCTSSESSMHNFMAGNKKQKKKVPPWSGLCTFVSPINIHSMEEEKKQIKIKRARSGFDQAPKEDPVPFAVCPHQECGCAATGCVVPKQECIVKGKPVDMKEMFNEVPPRKNEDPVGSIHRKNEREWHTMQFEESNKVTFIGIIEQAQMLSGNSAVLKVVDHDHGTYINVTIHTDYKLDESSMAETLGNKAGFRVHPSEIKWVRKHSSSTPITGDMIMDILRWLEFLPEQDQRDLIESRVSMTQFVEKIKKEFFV